MKYTILAQALPLFEKGAEGLDSNEIFQKPIPLPPLPLLAGRLRQGGKGGVRVSGIRNRHLRAMYF